MDKDKIIITSSDPNEAFDKIIKAYMANDVTIGEFLESVHIEGIPITQQVELFDELVEYFNETPDTKKATVLLTKGELMHLINDTIHYINYLEDRGATRPCFGYRSRIALKEKLLKIERETFPEYDCTPG